MHWNSTLSDFLTLQQRCRASFVLQIRCPVPEPAPDAPSSNAYALGFAARLMAKDLKPAQQTANDCDHSTNFSAEAARRFAEFAAGGSTELDFSAIYRSTRK